MIQISNLSSPKSWEEARRAATDDVELLEALREFEKLLGRRWRGWSENAPLATLFFTKFQNQHQEGVRLWKLAQYFGADAHLSTTLRQGLGSSRWEDFFSCVATLEVGGAFLAKGREFRLLQNDHRKTPDATVTIDDRTIVLECKKLQDSDSAAPWYALLQFFVDELALQGRGVADFDFQLQSPALEHKEQIVLLLAELKPQPNNSWLILPHDAGHVRVRPAGVILHRKPGTTVSRSSRALS